MQPPMKHVIETAQLGITAAQVTQAVVQGVLNPDPFTNITNVKAGSIVRALIIQIDASVLSGVAGDATFDWHVTYSINNAQSLPAPNSVGPSHLKNQVFHQDGALLSSTATSPSRPAVFRALVRIPKSWQQINDGDTIYINWIFSGIAGSSYNVKLRCIYTEYFP